MPTLQDISLDFYGNKCDQQTNVVTKEGKAPPKSQVEELYERFEWYSC